MVAQLKQEGIFVSIEEFQGSDGETTYIFGTDGWEPHLASMWCATERYGVYHIRTALEKIANAHMPLVTEQNDD